MGNSVIPPEVWKEYTDWLDTYMNGLEEALRAAQTSDVERVGPADEARDDHGRWTGGGASSGEESEQQGSGSGGVTSSTANRYWDGDRAVQEIAKINAAGEHRYTVEIPAAIAKMDSRIAAMEQERTALSAKLSNQDVLDHPSADSARFFALGHDIIALDNARAVLMQESTGFGRHIREQILEQVIYQNAGATYKLNAKYDSTITGKDRQTFIEGARTVERMTNPSLLQDPHKYGISVERGSTLGGRSYYQTSGQYIAFSAGSDHSTAVHELGHYIEDINPHIQSARATFVEHRTRGESPVSLEAITGGGYHPSELTLRDHFPDPYVGKVYSRHEASEVISMGMQAMHANPATFARKDPEHFKLVYNLLRTSRK